MSQHITGEVGQNVRQDFGEFVTIGDVRLRRDLIVAYNWCPITDDPKGRTHGVRALVNNGWIGIPVGSEEEMNKAIERLDWIFKKERS
jgi:hypothetical protein